MRSSASCSTSPCKHLYPVAQSRRKPSAWRWSRPAATAAACMAPGSDIDLLVPAALQADRLGRVGRRRHSLLPVGHRPEGRPRHPLGRRVHPPGQGRHDHPHRAFSRRAICSATARSTTSWSTRFDKEVVQRHRARSSSPPSSPSARSATAAPASRAIWSSRTSRTARAACATCTRCSGSPNTSTACASPTS